jgi:hypothetical protein
VRRGPVSRWTSQWAVGLALDAARRFFPHPVVRFVPIDGPRGEISIATREGDDRPAVRAFRRAPQVLARR